MTNPDSKVLNDLFRYDKVSGKLTWWNHPISEVKRGDEAGTPRPDGYRMVGFNYKTYLVHRVIWCMVYGSWPEKHIDHINRIRDDNRLKNLRLASRGENNRNHETRDDNQTGYSGVSYDARSINYPWKAGYGFEGTWERLGSFRTKREAVEARRKAEMKYNFHP